MEKEVWWSSTDEHGLERLRLSQNSEGVVAESLILRVEDARPFQLTYRIRCDRLWRVREVEIGLQDETGARIKINSDGRGNWTGAGGNSLDEFAGCFEVDVSATPFTNTLPLRRTRLEIGGRVDISVVYFLVPAMTVGRSEQRYTRLAEDLYRFEERGLFDGFSADLRVDEESLVVDYPNLFRRLK